MSTENSIKLNANKDFICGEFTEVLRDLVRSVAASEDCHGGIYRGAERMEFVEKLLAECEDDISWRDLFSAAIQQLRPERDWNDYDFPFIKAAQSGMSMLMEMTCHDNAARGRSSKRQSEFLMSIRRIEK